MFGHFPISDGQHLKTIVQSEGEHTSFKTYSPAPWLSPYVSRYIIIDSEEVRINRILPDTAVVMSFRLKGIVTSSKNDIVDELPRLAISGIRKSDRLINYQKGSSNLLVVFNPMGASAFVSESLHELFEITAPLDALKGFRHVAQLEDGLASTNDHKTVIALVEEFLLSRFFLPKGDTLVTKAVRVINDAQGNIRIKNLAEQLCISQDPLEKRFRRLTGVSPKQFAHISRMKMVIADVRSNRYHDLSEVVFHAGYFDLPHFHKDFRHFTGQTPAQFFQAPSYW